ncbi:MULTISPECIES: monovalent cation/H+ antiporter subunit A [Gammaproteobacteria]|uniref:monovalent cation/H+ antiporter subunit A n=1 Tax=Gammaproteobacteria TaxID=1236 RepID=UPI000DD0B0C4|nr:MULTISPECIES: monovalent cation/H+ antiporter subunit A [Gammaproteobacteria]RTE86650.1 monovalent cation/H+ antiporter subunit A [Aliidiomarina sp. B3213]TCZ90795.1 monovalent cation/H+ antiporter subunit A [Lysobacter sp. N42]
MALLVIVFLPILLAWVPRLTERFGRNFNLIVTLIPPLIAVGLAFSFLPSVLQGQTQEVILPWLPSMGLNLEFRIDALSLMFALLILCIGLFVVWYARFYLSEKDSLGKLYTLLLMFMTAMLGIVLSNNVLLLFVFWELTSITSFLLIGYWQDNSDARKGARMALAVTGGGGLALLAGVILLGEIAGSYTLTDIFAMHEVIIAHELYPVMLVLILLGAFTKSAQFPFHFWLPHAMAAPTPVSAYLHSATMVKAGIFLLARLHPAIAGTDLWVLIVTSTGLITMVFAAAMAMFKHDLKGLLAYSTVSHLGLITLLFGISTEVAVLAGIFHILNHAAFKATLFMSAGIVDHETGTRDLRVLQGMYKFMPITGILSILAGAAMAGVPLFNGFLSKEMMLKSVLHVPQFGSFGWLLPVIATFAALFSVYYSTRFVLNVFFTGEAKKTPKPPHEPPKLMLLPMFIMVAICVVVGIAPHLADAFVNTVGSAVLGYAQEPYHIAIWHGFNAPLLMSVIALVGGLLLYTQKGKLLAWYKKRKPFNELHIFEGTVTRIMSEFTQLVTRVENGSLQRYFAIAIVMLVAMIVYALLPISSLSGSVAITELDIVAAVASVVLIIAAFGTVLIHHNRFGGLLILSVAGLMVSILFARFSAPDLAMTQLSVEVVTIILLMLALYFLPQQTPNESSQKRVWRDASISGLAGIGIGVLAYGILTRPIDSISNFYLENAKPEGGGYNVVNVILVDFRGFDTFGEIIVLAIAGLGIATLLRNLYLPLPLTDKEGRPWDPVRHPPLLSMMARMILPLALMVSVFIFLRGHNAPGGGFIAGLITSIALILQYVASGVGFIRERIQFNYPNWIAAGVLIAAITGVGSWFLGYPFLTSTYTYIEWPIVGKFEISSALPFDLGVYLTVVATTLLILAYIGKLTTTARVDD